MIGDLRKLSTHRDRVAGFGETMTAAGVPAWADYVLEDAHDIAAAERAARALLTRPEPPTALSRRTTGSPPELSERCGGPAQKPL